MLFFNFTFFVYFLHFIIESDGPCVRNKCEIVIEFVALYPVCLFRGLINQEVLRAGAISRYNE